MPIVIGLPNLQCDIVAILVQDVVLIVTVKHALCICCDGPCDNWLFELGLVLSKSVLVIVLIDIKFGLIVK